MCSSDLLDLVLLDLTMPVLSGAETFERLRALQPGVKVLLMSGFSDDGQARKLLESGCNGFIHKPFALPDLLAKLRELGLS